MTTRNLHSAIFGALALLCVAPAARADGPANAVSVHLPSLGTTGVAVQYERFALPDRWSLAGGLGLNSAASGDYDSLALSASVELRLWLTGHSVKSSLYRAMAGPYFSARLDVSRTTTTDELDDRQIGDSLTLGETVSFGYRFAMWRRVELTPSIGLGARTDIDLNGRMAAWTRPAVSFGLTLGWMY